MNTTTERKTTYDSIRDAVRDKWSALGDARLNTPFPELVGMRLNSGVPELVCTRTGETLLAGTQITLTEGEVKMLYLFHIDDLGKCIPPKEALQQYFDEEIEALTNKMAWHLMNCGDPHELNVPVNVRELVRRWQDDRPSRIVAVVEGGMIQSVHAEHPGLVDFEIVDHDVLPDLEHDPTRAEELKVMKTAQAHAEAWEQIW